MIVLVFTSPQAAWQSPHPVLAGSRPLTCGLKPAEVVVLAHGPRLAGDVVIALPCTVLPSSRASRGTSFSVSTTIDVCSVCHRALRLFPLIAWQAPYPTLVECGSLTGSLQPAEVVFKAH